MKAKYVENFVSEATLTYIGTWVGELALAFRRASLYIANGCRRLQTDNHRKVLQSDRERGQCAYVCEKERERIHREEIFLNFKQLRENKLPQCKCMHVPPASLKPVHFSSLLGNMRREKKMLCNEDKFKKTTSVNTVIASTGDHTYLRMGGITYICTYG
jgi:hypothetical protein